MASNNNVEREIVQMVFEAKEFHKGIESSLKDIEDLKKSLQLKNATQGFKDVDKASKISFDPMSKSLDVVQAKISFLSIAAATMVSRVTNAVLDSVKKFANAVALDPIRTGLEEYETQLNSVQTILANTAKDGTTLEYVNEKLDELNLYADKTIYNFTQMTDSIGRFTAAGIDIDTATSSIKGFANVAALSGSNAQQASTGMYQLSQAMASGTVRLQDWMSIENAGMGGAVFQDALKETARAHGVAVDAMIEKNGSFRYSLQEQWLSADIMAETLLKFTGDLNRDQLISMGYAEEQIDGILKMAVTANEAATKIKTLTQLKETLAEALQSGWGQTWRIIFGDFEEAKELWGTVSTIFGNIIEQSSEARNGLLAEWAEFGGRDILIEGLLNLLNAGINILYAFKDGVSAILPPLKALELFASTINFKEWTEDILDLTTNNESLVKVISAVVAIFDIVRLAIAAVLKPLRAWLDTLDSTGATLGSFIVSVADAILAWREWAIEADFFDMVVETVISKIGYFIDMIKKLVDQFKKLEFVKDVSKWLSGLSRDDLVRTWDNFLGVVEAIAVPIRTLVTSIRAFVRYISELDAVKKVSEYFGDIEYADVKQGFKDIANSLQELIDSVKNAEIIQALRDYFSTFDGRRFTQFIEDAKSGFSWLTDGAQTLADSTTKWGGALKSADDSMKDVGSGSTDALVAAFEKLKDGAENLDYSGFFKLINTGLATALTWSLATFFSGGWIDKIMKGIFGDGVGDIGEALTGALEGFNDTMGAVQNNIKSDTIKNIAISIGLLALSLVLLTQVDSNKLTAASFAIATMIGVLFGSAGALSLIKTDDATKGAIAIGALAIAIGIASVAIKTLSGIKAEEIETTLAALAGGLAALVLGVHGISGAGDSGMLKTVGVVIALAVGLNLLVGVVRKFGDMKPDVLAQGLMGVAGSIGILVAAIAIISNVGEGDLFKAANAIVTMSGAMLILGTAVNVFGNMDINVLSQGLKSIGIALAGFGGFSRLLDPKGMFSASLAIGVISVALLLLVEVVKRFGEMEWEELQRGLIGLAGVLLILAVASRVMSGSIAGAAAMIVMSIAVLALSVSLKVLSTIPWEGLGKGLLGLAGIFLVLGLAGLLLAPVVPVILALGVGMLLMGLAAVTFGAGLMVASTGLIAIAASAGAVAAAITIVGGAVIQLLPALGAAIAEALAGFLQVIAEKQPVIVEAMKSIILGMIEASASLVPDLIALVFDVLTEILTTIATRLPDLVQAGFDILLAFLQGIADNIAEVVATGLEIITEFINGLAEGIPDLIDAAFNLILEFLNAIAAAIDEYFEQILEAGGRIGAALIKGILNAMKTGAIDLYNYVKELATTMLDKIKKALLIKSPSRKTYEIGMYMVIGLIDAIRDYGGRAANAAATMAQSALDQVAALVDGLSTDIDSELSISPVITPVLSLDSVTAGAGQIRSLFANNSILAGVSRDMSEGLYSSSPDSTDSTSVGGPAQYIFEQNNYSPKAISREEVFRQTKSLLAQAGMVGNL